MQEEFNIIIYYSDKIPLSEEVLLKQIGRVKRNKSRNNDIRFSYLSDDVIAGRQANHFGMEKNQSRGLVLMHYVFLVIWSYLFIYGSLIYKEIKKGLKSI